jgi:hypothetical protein
MTDATATPAATPPAPFLQFFNGTEIKMTTAVDQLFTAVSKVQGALATIKTDATGQVGSGEYPYAKLPGLLKELNPLLAQNGLAFSQFPVPGGMINLIGHNSGQWLMARFDHGIKEVGGRGNPYQQMGSGITYTRRYCALAIWCVAAEDDDGAGSGAGSGATSRPTPPVQPSPAPPPVETPDSGESGTLQPASPVIARLNASPPAINFDFMMGPADTSAFWFHTLEKIPFRSKGRQTHFYRVLTVTGEQFATFSDTSAQIIGDAIAGKIGCDVEWTKVERQGGKVGYNLKTVMPLQGKAGLQSMTLIVQDRAVGATGFVALVTDRGRFGCPATIAPQPGEEIRCIIQPTSRGRLITEILQPTPETPDDTGPDQQPDSEPDGPRLPADPAGPEDATG